MEEEDEKEDMYLYTERKTETVCCVLCVCREGNACVVELKRGERGGRNRRSAERKKK